MNNFKPGGIRHRRDDIGGRPRSDANYGPKNRFDNKPRHDDRGGDRGGDRGDRGDRGGNRGGDRFDKGPRKDVELFQTTCTTCGKSCEVPFRPDGSKPVLCKECFSKKNASPMGGNNFERRDRFESNVRPERTERPQQAPVADLSAITRQVAALESKLNEVLGLLQTQNHKPAHVSVAPNAPEKKVEVVAPRKVEKTSPDSKMLVVGKDNTKAIATKAPEKKVVAKKAVVKKEVAKKEVKKAAPKKVAAKKAANKAK